MIQNNISLNRYTLDQKKVQNNNKNIQFKADIPNKFKSSLPLWAGSAAWLMKTQGDLKHIRFIQDTATNWVPKVAFSRSKADFGESTFLEFAESALFYYMPGIMGEGIRKIITKLHPNNEILKENIATKATDLIKNAELKNSGALKRLLPAKAAIVLGCVCIPVAEYTLSFVKNLLTLKVFKQSDFNNIANLDKNQKENPEQQKKVEKSAKDHIKKAAILSGIGFAASIAFAVFGHKSKALQKASEYILMPGTKIHSGLKKLGLAKESSKNNFEKYLNLDFDKNKTTGKLELSNGQLAFSVILGLYGYLQAAKDRGRLDFLENATRVPVVAFYTIFGSSILQNGLKKVLQNKNAFKHLITKNADGSLGVVAHDKLPELAAKLAQKNGTTDLQEYKKLFKGETILTAVPFLFSLGVMGFFIAGMSRFWTNYRYKHSAKQEDPNKLNTNANTSNISLKGNNPNELFKRYQPTIK